MAFAPTALRAQITLTNGAQTAGTLLANATNVYTFDATNGDAILLRIGSAAMNPSIVLRNPLGQIFASAGSGAAGAHDPNIATQSTNTGTFTVEVSSIFAGGSGAYSLNLAHIPGGFVVSPGDDGGPMTNGWLHTGTNSLGDLDLWTFTANAGDSVILRMGSPTFNPWIRLFGPDGKLVATAGNGASGFLNVDLATQATNGGIYTVVASSFMVDGTGNYSINLAKAPGAVFVAPGDAGGPLTNGWQHTGSLNLGDLDVWTFNANAGESIVLRMGSANYNPWIRLFGPDGKQVGAAGSGAAGFLNVDLAATATNSGTYTVVVGSFSGNNTGSYILNLAESPEPVFVAPGDEGGPMTNGWKHTGNMDLGDLDLWTFNANAGDSIVLRMGSSFYNPWIRLFGPDGKQVGAAGSGAAGFLNVELATQATNSGTYTVVVSSFSGNNTGSYLLNFAESSGPSFVAPGDEGGPLTNGWKHAGTIDLGDLDLWTFNANAGDSVILRMGSSSYNPFIRLYGPDGKLVATAGGGAGGFLNVDLATVTTNGGTYMVVVSSFSGNNTGLYTLNLAKPGPVFVSPGDDGGPLTNGWEHTGAIDLGDLDMWTFSANAGDSIVLRMGSSFYNPLMRLFGPDGKLAATAGNGTGGFLNVELATQATNSGTYTLVVSSVSGNNTGAYTLNMAKSPGEIFVAQGDEGGPLTNGWKHTGNIDLGDLDAWTFDANPGDNIVFRMASAFYNPLVRIYRPDGKLAATAGNGVGGNLDVSFSFVATNAGSYTVVASSVSGNNTGSYLINMAQMPGTLSVAPGDEGGSLFHSAGQAGTIDLGDMDIWRFGICRGQTITLSCQKVSGNFFTPRLRLYSRTGTLLATAANASVATLAFTPTNSSGLFIAIVDGNGVNDSGTYLLTGNGFSDELNLCPPLVSGTNIDFAGIGGGSNATFVLYSSTNFMLPRQLWIPVLTNQFNSVGTFEITNLFAPGVPQQYFQMALPQ